MIREGVSMRGSMVRIRYKYEVANIGFHALRDITQLEDSAVKGWLNIYGNIFQRIIIYLLGLIFGF